jgi:hypothetical protein
MMFGIRRNQFSDPKHCPIRRSSFKVVASKTCIEGHFGICKSHDKEAYKAFGAFVGGIGDWIKSNDVQLGDVVRVQSFGDGGAELKSLYLMVGYIRLNPLVHTFLRLALDDVSFSFATDDDGCLDVVLDTGVAKAMVTAAARRIDAAKVSILSGHNRLGSFSLKSVAPAVTVVQGEADFAATRLRPAARPVPSHTDSDASIFEAAFASCPSVRSSPGNIWSSLKPPKVISPSPALPTRFFGRPPADQGGGDGFADGLGGPILVDEGDKESGTDADCLVQPAVATLY